MGHKVETIIDLLQFNYGVTFTELAGKAGIKVSQIHSAKYNDVITRKTHQAIASVYGDDWDDIKKIRLYQQRKNIVGSIDSSKLAKLREEKGLAKYEAAKLFQMNNMTLEAIETGERTFRSWPEYMKFVNYYDDDLMKGEKPKKAKKSKRAKHFMTFKNIATRGSRVSWQTGRRIVV